MASTHFKGRALALLAFGVTVAGASNLPQSSPSHVPAVPTAEPRLLPTAHPPVPSHPSQFWLVPADDPAGSAGVSSALAGFARGVQLHLTGRSAEALPLLTEPALAQSPLADYALYYVGLAQLALARSDEARAAFATVRARGPQGYLSQAAPLQEAVIAEGQGDFASAADLYGLVATGKPAAPDEVQLGLARSFFGSSRTDEAIRVLREIYFRFPLSAASTSAAEELERLDATPEPGESKAFYALHLGRAERLFGSRRYQDARSGFEALRPHASGDDRELVALRIAECDFYLRRYASARDQLAPYLSDASRKAEARFFYLSALRELNQDDEYIRRTRELAEEFPDSSWTEEALNNLATFHILEDADEEAAAVFREMFRKFPTGARADRAAWRSGWWAYRTGEHAEAIRIFEAAAAAMPRTDSRPAYLYWAARSHEKLGRPDAALSRYQLVVADYRNSYYGRLAAGRTAGLRAAGHLEPVSTTPAVEADAGGVTSSAEASDGQAGPGPVALPTQGVIQLLISLELYDDALNELLFAERTWGESPAIQATQAWVYGRKGDLRRGINLMKRAYPQYMASGGEALPVEIRKVIFPVDYWDLIRSQSNARSLDPHLVAALVAQESTFLPAVRSSANAYGLMQIVPSTGRRIARSIGIPRFSTSRLTEPETNVRIGTTYFARLVDQLGGLHLALASYNAGEHRVTRWMAERPGLEVDEFVDDIPFPETQNYVKRILGTAEDYRLLYGERGASSGAAEAPTAGAAPAAAPAKAPAGKKPAVKPAPKKPAPKKSATRKPATRKS